MGKPFGNWLYRIYLALGLVLVGLTILFTLIPQAWIGFQTGLFVAQILDAPLKPQSWFNSQPTRREIAYPRPDGEGFADLYRIPDDRKRAGVLIFLGANAAGRDDPDVINLGDALARAGFVVMLHWSPTMGLRLNIDPDEVENLVWAFQHLQSLAFVDRERIGMGGFSVGGSFAMVAAADPRIRDDVVFLNSFGAYYDAHDLFVQVASRSRIFEGQREPWEVDPLTRLVFANELIESLDDPMEQELFSRRYLRDEEGLEEELSGASDQAHTVRRLLEGTTPEEAEILYQNLPAQLRRDLQRISPSAHISGLKARLMIMHDRGDRLIPAAESRRLVQALEDRGNFRYTETEVFEHVRPGSESGTWALFSEAFKLYRHMYGIVRVAA